MPTPEEIVKRLEPKHLTGGLPESTEDLKTAVQKAAEESVKEMAKPRDDARSQKEFTFNFSWADGQGKVWRGEFVNRILNIGERQLVGAMRARLATSVPDEALDPLTREINLMVAHMTYSLKEKPDWANDLRKLEDVQLLQALFTEVMKHEDTFFGRNAGAENG